jgi:excisionase family DNA binding protein
MATRRQAKVKIRVHSDVTTTQETPAKPSSSAVGNPSYAKARAKVPLPKQKRPVNPKNSNGRFATPPEPEPVEAVSPNGDISEPVQEIPQPNEEALRAKDLVRVDDILRNPVLTPDEVGTLLRVSPSTVMKLVSDGELPAMRVHRETRLLRIDILQFMRDLHNQREQHEKWLDGNPRFAKARQRVTR